MTPMELLRFARLIRSFILDPRYNTPNKALERISITITAGEAIELVEFVRQHQTFKRDEDPFTRGEDLRVSGIRIVEEGEYYVAHF